MRTFGLIGSKLKHSFSSQYFNKKFLKENITNSRYINFELKEISDILELIKKEEIKGLNVTIPYKEEVIPFLDDITPNAQIIQAVNTIELKNGKLIGHNTDTIGFKRSIMPILENRSKALILGSGGGSKAVKYALSELNIEHEIIGRKTLFTYSDITAETINYYDIIINTTPLGMFPEIEQSPEIPFKYLNSKHLLFDLTYNPQESLFLTYGKKQSCKIKNGLEMLYIQAEESWNIWNP